MTATQHGSAQLNAVAHADAPATLPVWSTDVRDDDFRPVHGASEGFAQEVHWLSHPQVDWLTDPQSRPNDLRGGIVHMGVGAQEGSYSQSQDSYLLGGLASLHVDGETLQLSAGDSIAIGAGTTLALEVHEPLRMFTVFAGHRPSDVVAPGVRHAAHGLLNVTFYDTDTVIAGEPVRHIEWLREGPEGTGGFFSGLFSIAEGSYTKRFVVNEFVLLLQGRKEIAIGESTMIFEAGQIAAYTKGWLCSRRITAPVMQFFAGR